MNAPRSLIIITTIAALVAAGAACGSGVEPLVLGSSSGATTDGIDPSTGLASTTGTTADPPGTTIAVSDETSDDATFLEVPDGGGCVSVGDGTWHCSRCDVGAQDCPEGEKCVPWANDGGEIWNATRCSPLPAQPAGLGEACTVERGPASGFDDCARGTMCWTVDPRTLEGTCVASCGDDLDCRDGMACPGDFDFAPFVCLPYCDPLDPASCAADEICRDVGQDAICVPVVALPQGIECGVDDQYCALDQACLYDHLLADCADPQCCTVWCDLAAPDPDLPCAARPGEVCRPFYVASGPAGYDHVGVCGLPR